MPDGSGNVYAGGLSFSPLVSAGATGIYDPSGGLHFDLPLATLQSMQNNALAFTAGRGDNNQGFLASVLAMNAGLVGSTVKQATATSHAATVAATSLGYSNIQLATHVSDNALEASKYAVQQQSYQVNAQTSASKWKKLFGGLTGGIFG